MAAGLGTAAADSGKLEDDVTFASATTMDVLPEVEDVDIVINDSDR